MAFKWNDLVLTPLRNYQIKMCQEASQKNSIVVLPTGSGKTMIAIALAVYHSLQNRNGGKTLFLVPTQMLVGQQGKAIESNTKLRVALYHGELSWPKQEFDVLVSTPEAFRLKIAQSISNFNLFSLVVFDEVHHVVKQHPYKKLARLLEVSHPKPTILGLTATCTYAITNNQIESEISKLCQTLDIHALLSASNDELIKDGYHGSTPDLLLHTKSEDKIEKDKEKRKEKEIQQEIRKGKEKAVEKRKVDEVEGDEVSVVSLSVADKIVEGNSTFAPHQNKEAFFHSIKSQTADPLLLRIAKLTQDIEEYISQSNPALNFSSPLQTKGKRGKVTEWAVYANQLKIPLGIVLMHLYEAMRLMVVSWSTAMDLVVEYLTMTMITKELLSYMIGDFALVAQSIIKDGNQPQYRERFVRLETVLLDQLTTHSSFRGILFVQQRLTTHILKHFIDTNPRLSSKIKCECIYATSSECNPVFKVTPSESKNRVKAFSLGQINLLISTAVAEEGMDVPAANSIIRFDPIQTPVSLIQGRGRARQEQSTFVVMEEREDRPLENLAKAEKTQMTLLQTHSTEILKDAHSEEYLKKKAQAQIDRERTAQQYLKNAKGNSAFIVKQFCTKIGSEVLESYSKDANGWKIMVNVHGFGGLKLEEHATTPSKQEAKQQAYNNILLKLTQQDNKS